jgi:two-component system, chemotaxis family, protein-glutamate methylesterase/glutaminase
MLAINTPDVRSVSAPIRILVVDDSVVARAMIARVIADDARFVMAAALDRADRARIWLQDNRTDIVLLDIAMPGQNGIDALPGLMAVGGDAHFVIVSALAAEGATATLHALSLGAADVIAKPGSGSIGRDFGAVLVDRLLRLTRGTREPVVASHLRESATGPIGCLAIGASTGGIPALAAFFEKLPPHFNAPILVTQHLPDVFMPSFAVQLSELAHRPCSVALDGMVLAQREIYLAPGNAHLTIVQRRGAVVVALSRRPAPSRCMPAVDAMFESVAAAYGDGAVGVVLSGMGRDGAHGAIALAAAGGSLVVQDAASAVVWGMPGAIVSAGLASVIATPAQLAEHIGWRGAVS